MMGGERRRGCYFSEARVSVLTVLVLLTGNRRGVWYTTMHSALLVVMSAAAAMRRVLV